MATLTALYFNNPKPWSGRLGFCFREHFSSNKTLFTIQKVVKMEQILAKLLVPNNITILEVSELYDHRKTIEHIGALTSLSTCEAGFQRSLPRF